MTPARKVAKQMRRDTTIFADAVRSQEWGAAEGTAASGTNNISKSRIGRGGYLLCSSLLWRLHGFSFF